MRDLSRIYHEPAYVWWECAPNAHRPRHPMQGPLTKPQALRVARAHAKALGHPVYLTIVHRQIVEPPDA